MIHDYVVFIRWDGNSVFVMPVDARGPDARKAAHDRVLLLQDPYRYDDVLAVDRSYHGVAKIFSITELLGSTAAATRGLRMPQRRYGWKG